MEREFNLIKNDVLLTEKRIFPRFPIGRMVFKSSIKQKQVFEVKDISSTGMQLSLKDGEHQFDVNESIWGTIQWTKSHLDVIGVVKWISGKRLGLSFQKDGKLEDQISSFLSVENVIHSMRPIHQTSYELPVNLKYWLRADGPVELFIWQHADGELSKFQFIIMNQFVEWQDGKGLQTGNIQRLREADSPLNAEDEFIFAMDTELDVTKITQALIMAQATPCGHLPEQAREFLLLKLGK